MRLLPFLVIACLILSIQPNNFPFEKKIWTYWHEQDLTSAPMLVRQCSQHIRQAAQKAGFQYFRLSQTTVKQHISNFQQKITKVRQKSKQGGLAAQADLIRFNLLYENGGIWIDITTFFPSNNIDWLVNISTDQYRNIITNRFSQQPQVMLVYFQGYQNTEQYRITNPNNKSQLILYNEMPGYQAWFFAAKKQSKLIEEIKQTYTRFTQMQFDQMVEIFHNEDIYMNNVDFGTYLTVDMAACYTLQKKQLQLDQSKTLFSSRPNVYEYYKLWSLSAVLGPLFWTRNQNWAVNHMIELSKQQYQQQGDMINLFIKNLGWFSSRLQQKMHRGKQLFYQQKLTFEQFLSSNPNQGQRRQTTFLSEDSIIYKVLQNSTQLKSGQYQVLTKQEKKKWHQYCKKYQKKTLNDWIEDILFSRIRPIDGTTYRAHEIVDFDKKKTQSFSQNVNDYFFQRKANFQFFFKFLVHFSVANIIQVTLILVLYFLWKKFRKNSYISIENHTKSHEKLSFFLNFLAIIFIGTLSFYKYFMIDYFGFRDDPQGIIIVLIIVFYLQTMVEKHIEKSWIIKTLYNLQYLYINYCTTYMTFCLMRRYKVLLFYCTVIVGLLGPCLIKLYNSMNVYKQVNNPILNFIKQLSDQNVFRICSLTMLLIIYIFPSIRYFAISDHYIISFIPIILSLMVILFSLILFYECIKTMVKRQLLNLLILGYLTYKLYKMFYDRNRQIDQNQRRNAWNMIVIAMFTMIYLQIGSVYISLANKFRLAEKVQQKLYVRLVKVALQLLIYFGAFAFEFYKGYFVHMGWIPYDLKKWFTQMFYIALYCFFIGVYVNFNNQRHQQQLGERKIQPINQMEEFSMVANSEIGMNR